MGQFGRSLHLAATDTYGINYVNDTRLGPTGKIPFLMRCI